MRLAKPPARPSGRPARHLPGGGSDPRVSAQGNAGVKRGSDRHVGPGVGGGWDGMGEIDFSHDAAGGSLTACEKTRTR